MTAVVIVSAIADWIMVLIAQYIPIGIQWPGIILPLVLAWYIITELGSILENAVKMGPNRRLDLTVGACFFIANPLPILS